MRNRVLFIFLLCGLQASLVGQQYHIPVVTNLQAGLLDSTSAVLTSNYYDSNFEGIYHHHLFINAGDHLNLGVGVLDNDAIGKDLIYVDLYINLLKRPTTCIAFAFKALKIDGVDDFLGFPELYGTFGNPSFNVTLGYSVAMNINEFDFENFVAVDGIYGFGGIRLDLLKSLGSGSLRLFANNNIARANFGDYNLINKTGIQGEYKNLILRAGLNNFISLENTEFRGTELFVGAGFRFE